MSSRFVYVTYIRTTPDKLWQALTTPEFSRLWFSANFDSSWQTGAPWTLATFDGTLRDSGEVLEADPPKRLVLSWRNAFMPEMIADGDSRCSFDLVPEGDLVRLSVIHEIEREKSKLIEGVSGGWPKFLSSLKSLLETGAPLPGKHK